MANTGKLKGKNMIKAGIDVGSRSTKVVILKNNKVISKHILPTGWKPENAAEKCFAEECSMECGASIIFCKKAGTIFRWEFPIR